GPDITWERIAADPVPHIDAGWTGFNPGSPPMEDLIPWPVHQFQDRPVYSVQPLEPIVKNKPKIQSCERSNVITKRYRTNFKGLSRGETPLEAATTRPDAPPSAGRARPTPWAKPPLWIAKATLHFDEDDKTLSAIHIYDVGFVDINGIAVGG